MSKQFRNCDLNQAYLLPPSLQDWLPEGHLARFVAEAAERDPVLQAFGNIDGVVPITHQTGCGMSATNEGYRTLYRTLAGYAKNPNFGGILLLGLGCEVMQIPDLVGRDKLREDGNFRYMTIQQSGGTRRTIERALEVLRESVERASRLPSGPGWERKAAAHAEIFRLLADVAPDPAAGGALGLTRAADHVRAYPQQAAAILAVEICSLNFQRDDLAKAHLIAAGLFGDGAVAVVPAPPPPAPPPSPPPRPPPASRRPATSPSAARWSPGRCSPTPTPPT